MRKLINVFILLFLVIGIVACGGGSSGGSGGGTPEPPSNQAPTAVAPADFNAIESTNIMLDGSASTDDVSISAFLWEQIDGVTVALSNANTATTNFTAPAFIANQTQTMTFRLTVTDSAGATATDDVVVTVIETPPQVTLSGKITFDLISHNVSTNGLDYSNITQSAVRGTTVELLNANKSSILQTTFSDENGNYSFSVTGSASYVVRVKAELKKQGAAPTWDFTVVDNTNGQALYAMDSPTQAVQSTGVVLNMNAASGWGGSSYTGTRVAAPFAILDAVYKSAEKMVAVDADIVMPALKLNWSVNNVAADGDTDNGQIGTSHFNGTEIYILGDADNDTDEYDDHVIIHEWGHYFEGQLSRSDSIGGPHSGSQKLDMRLAVGEGFGNALSGIITDDPFYRDSFGAGQSQGFDINVEANPTTNKGWYSEFSVQSFLYDIYDSDNDGADTLSLGFSPIYEALISGEKTTEALTSIFSLATQIKIKSPTNTAAIDTLLASQDIIAADDFGSTETNDGGDARNLPIYKTATIGGGAVQVCSFATNGQSNKLGNRQFIVFDVASSTNLNFTATAAAGSNPDFILHRQGSRVFISDGNGNESVSRTLATGKYILEVAEASNIQTDTAKDVCIDVTISAN